MDLTALRAIEHKVRWIAASMIDAANSPARRDPAGLKVGGHQASSASIATIMTTLWFAELTRLDRVSVKPHASPVLHAINFLLGELEPEDMATLRQFGGLQSYPSRSKDRDTVDYSTGSVGIGATAPIWGAIAHRYAADASGQRRPPGRQFSLVGDAELDEGAVWEALLDPMVADLGEVVWIVDFNRQSLDRVVPNISGTRLQSMFHAAGWQVIEAKYGVALTEAFKRAGGEALKRRIEQMTNGEYQRMLRCDAQELRRRLPGDGEGAATIRRLLDGYDDDRVCELVGGLAGHDVEALIGAFAQIDESRPTVIFAYTIKGHGLANAGHPQNHSNLLTPADMRELAARSGESIEDPWRRFDEGSDAGALVRDVADRLRRDETAPAPRAVVPAEFARLIRGTSSTQQALGRLLMDLARTSPDTARRVVTVAPDVASSTNLGGWVNKVGVWSSTNKTDWFADDAETILHWKEQPGGQHIELGIAEGNLVGLLGELGATWSRWGEPLLPIGTLYDPFVTRALEPWSFGVYSGGQSILVGTPSGITLAAEGGAHQSIITPSIGIEQPGVVSLEPAFAQDFEWLMLEALSRLGHSGGSGSYFRLSSRPIDQARAEVPEDPDARERRRRHVLAGAYVLRGDATARLALVGMGAVMPEVLDAAERLDREGIPNRVVCVTSADRLYRAVRARRGLPADDADGSIIDAVFRGTDALVAVLDGHPHTLDFLGGAVGAASVVLGTTEFGQSGHLDDVYAAAGIGSRHIRDAAKDLLARP
ncbi:transketolase-like TK C-terminal-containing protein [Microbacterium aoyamense]|uniref:transketolase-like TK C-terminal-containing protein n=1 Tax=Microbacterium aoyamense TaxID=344166 RepID=UPI0031DA26C5